MTDRDKKVIDYMVVIVNEYAEESGISSRDAFNRLDACGGIQAIEDNYEIEHTLPISSTVSALAALCGRMEAAS